MCGIVGVIAKGPVNQLIYDALLLLQHRGQDAAGIVTMQGTKCFMHKARGMVRDVFRTRNMRALPGNVGLGQVRYPTAGNAYSEEEAQPFYVNAPFGIVLVHNGNLTNAAALKEELFDVDRRHINTDSDTEVLINVLAHELEVAARDKQLSPEEVFAAVAAVHRRIKGSYAVVALIAGHGLLAFRDPFGIRPLAFGEGTGPDGPEVIVASESVAIDGTGHVMARDVAPGEAVFIDLAGHGPRAPVRREPAALPVHVRVRLPGAARLDHGRHLGLPGAPEPGRDAGAARDLDPAADRDRRRDPDPRVEPAVGDAARAALGKPYREGFVKNRYVGRTFIMPGQGVRKKSVRQKLNAIEVEFKGRNVLLVDDSIVRGTTSRRSCRWRATPARGRCTSPRRRRRCAIPTSTASTCRPAPS